jgi:hypothetical protein
MKRLFFAVAALILSTATLLPGTASAQIGVNIIIGNAPPPLRYEVRPGPRRGYQWAPGYWNWNGRNHIWAGGHWERSRPGYLYSRPQWQRDGQRWRLNRGGWHQNRAVRVEQRGRGHGRDHYRKKDHRGHDRKGGKHGKHGKDRH